jgi:Xaa-Pro aminopeptidase
VADVFKDPRKREYLNAEGVDRPLRSPIPHETLVAARAHRKRRMAEQVAANDCAAILLYDPVNIRYALDVSNMQVWAAHNPFHYALVFADGHAVDFEFRNSEHLAANLETVDEIRRAIAWFYMYSGDGLEAWVDRWAGELVAVLRERYGGGELRLAVDKLEPPGVDALRRHGVVLVEGQRLTEHARLVKSADEIALMRWTIRVCEAGMARMYEASVAGRTEQEIWAELHHENIRSGGEWIETRLLAVGDHTNPWLQECSGRVAEPGEMLAFDTDMIGPYGYCADLSRSWTIDHVRMTPAQADLYANARAQIEHNLALVQPGMDYLEFSRRSWPIPDRFLQNRYSCLAHGVGMADEYPGIYAPQDAGDYDHGRLEPGMVVCVESLIGEQGRGECVKLETQVLVTETGAERLDSFPWEDG